MKNIFVRLSAVFCKERIKVCSTYEKSLNLTINENIPCETETEQHRRLLAILRKL